MRPFVQLPIELRCLLRAPLQPPASSIRPCTFSTLTIRSRRHYATKPASSKSTVSRPPVSLTRATWEGNSPDTLDRRKRAPPGGYKDKILIYHAGSGRIGWTGATRAGALLLNILALTLSYPAFMDPNVPVWTPVALSLLGTLPILLVTYITRPFVHTLHLHLPPTARPSPSTVLYYTSHLPPSATLTLKTHHLLPMLTSTTTVPLRDLRPASSWFRPLSFENLDREGSGKGWFTPTVFYVQGRDGLGGQVQNWVEGAWGNVYKRLVQGREDDSVRGFWEKVKGKGKGKGKGGEKKGSIPGPK